MNDKSFKYGILIHNAILKDASNSDNLSNRTVLLGQILKIEAELSHNKIAVKVLKEGETWDVGTFYASKDDIIPVAEKFWPFLAAIASPIERVKLAQNKSKCEKLMQITKEMTVGFTDVDNVYLGTVKYIGSVKGMGKCVGILLHEKKPKNRCNGSCAGIQYFNCLPGYGIFTTIERILPHYPELTTTTPKLTNSTSELDDLSENIHRINTQSMKDERSLLEKPHHEEIITRYNQYPKTTTAAAVSNKNTACVRTSLSLQNILDLNEGYSVNTNNDFDQNTIIQPDSAYLMRRNANSSTNSGSKTEVDLIDMIGGFWGDNPDSKQADSFVNLRKSVKSDSHHSEIRNSYNNIPKNMRNRSTNVFSHIIESGSKTLPRKSKLLQENVTNGENGISISTGRSEENCSKLSERNEALAKASTSQLPSKAVYYEPEPGTTNDFTLGSLVEVSNDVSDEPLYGVIRWMGTEAQSKFILVGIELEEEQLHLPLTLTDGTHNGERFFQCASNRALFVPLKQCHRDSRFQDGTPTPVQHTEQNSFIQDCPIIQGSVAPLCMPTEEDVEAVCGKNRGIQGHHNSCYLDVTLFAMFTYTAVFDSLLFRPKGPTDIPHYEEVQRVLREEIVNPLRKNLFVRADRVMNLRKLLDRLSSVSGLTCEEKDPEEFLNSLLAQILKAKPFLKLNSGQEAYHYQLFVEKDDKLTLPTVQQLFEQSFLSSDIKLKEVPSCLIIQMPRFGKSYKMYPRILPSQLLDVTDVIENCPRQCTVCGKLARWECRECFGECGEGLESTTFCSECLEKAHSHIRRASHSPRRLTVSQDFAVMEDHCTPPRLFMELFAVICIETSHYVAFVKCGVGHEAPWCFFDSMADRQGEKNGHNIPEMVACPNVSKWLSDEQSCRSLHENNPLDRHLPEHARRLLCDAYICMYQSPDVMMYR